MPSAVNGREPEVAGAALDVPPDLLSVHVRDVVGSPGLNDVPVQVIDPGLCPESGHCSVRVTRVLKHIVLVLQQRVDPLSGILVWGVVDVRAEIPLRRLGIDVQLT